MSAIFVSLGDVHTLCLQSESIYMPATTIGMSSTSLCGCCPLFRCLRFDACSYNPVMPHMELAASLCGFSSYKPKAGLATLHASLPWSKPSTAELPVWVHKATKARAWSPDCNCQSKTLLVATPQIPGCCMTASSRTDRRTPGLAGLIAFHKAVTAVRHGCSCVVEQCTGWAGHMPL